MAKREVNTRGMAPAVLEAEDFVEEKARVLDENDQATSILEMWDRVVDSRKDDTGTSGAHTSASPGMRRSLHEIMNPVRKDSSKLIEGNAQRGRKQSITASFGLSRTPADRVMTREPPKRAGQLSKESMQLFQSTPTNFKPSSSKVGFRPGVQGLLQMNLLQPIEKEVKHAMENPLLENNQTKTPNLFQQSKHSHKRLVDTLGSKAVDFLEEVAAEKLQQEKWADMRSIFTAQSERDKHSENGQEGATPFPDHRSEDEWLPVRRGHSSSGHESIDAERQRTSRSSWSLSLDKLKSGFEQAVTRVKSFEPHRNIDQQQALQLREIREHGEPVSPAVNPAEDIKPYTSSPVVDVNKRVSSGFQIQSAEEIQSPHDTQQQNLEHSAEAALKAGGDELHQPKDSKESPTRTLRSHAITTDTEQVSEGNELLHKKNVDSGWLQKAMEWMPALIAFLPRALVNDLIALARNMDDDNQARLQLESTRAMDPGGSTKEEARTSGKSRDSQLTSKSPVHFGGVRQPHMGNFQGAVLVADITGFTAMTEKLSQDANSTAGVELLTKCMNSYFTSVIDLIQMFGGDVIKFAGDAIIVAFRPHAEDEQALEPAEVLEQMTMMCIQCALCLTDKLGTCKMNEDGTISPIPQERDATRTNSSSGIFTEEMDNLLLSRDQERRKSSRLSGAPLPNVSGNVGNRSRQDLETTAKSRSTQASDSSEPQSREDSVLSNQPERSPHPIGGLGGIDVSSIVQEARMSAASSRFITQATARDKAAVNRNVSGFSSSKAAEQGGMGGSEHAYSTTEQLSGPVSGRQPNSFPNTQLPRTKLLPRLSTPDASWSLISSFRRHTTSAHYKPPSEEVRANQGSVDLAQRTTASAILTRSRSGVSDSPSQSTSSSTSLSRCFTHQGSAWEPGVGRGEAHSGNEMNSGSQAARSVGYTSGSELVQRDADTVKEAQLHGAQRSRKGVPSSASSSSLPTSTIGTQSSPAKTADPVLKQRSRLGMDTLDVGPGPVCESFKGGRGFDRERAARELATLPTAPLAAGPVCEAYRAAPQRADQRLDQLMRVNHQANRDHERRGSSGGLSRIAGSTLVEGQGSVSRLQASPLSPSGGNIGVTDLTPSKSAGSRKSPELPLKGMLSKKLLTQQARARIPRMSTRKVNTEKEDMYLSIKVTIGAGTIYSYHVGGYKCPKTSMDRWEFFLGDRPHSMAESSDHQAQPMQQIADTEHHAAARTVVASPEVAAIVKDRCAVTVLDDKGCVRIDDANIEEEALQESSRNERRMSQRRRSVETYMKQQVIIQALPERLLARVAQMMRAHVLDNVRQRIEAGHKDLVNEIRVCTVLFIGVPSLQARLPNDVADDVALGHVQDTMMTIQDVLYKLDGGLLQFRQDEKGFLLIAAFGLPGRAHEDSPQRAVQAALDLCRSLEVVGQRACVGVSTGKLLCACVGSAQRAEYTVYGDAINLSARLMCKAKAGLGQILVEQCSYALTKRRFQFQELEPIRAKGKAELIPIFLAVGKMPTGRRVAGVSSPSSSGYATTSTEIQASQLAGQTLNNQGASNASTSARSGDDIRCEAVSKAEMMQANHNRVGRTGSRPRGKMKGRRALGRERTIEKLTGHASQYIARSILGVSKTDVAGIAVLEGDVGMGKSIVMGTLYESLSAVMQQFKCHSVYVQGSDFNRKKLYGPWRCVMRSVFKKLAEVPSSDRADTSNLGSLGTYIEEAGKSRKRVHIPNFNQNRAMLADALDLNPDDIPTLESEAQAPTPSTRPITQTNPALTTLKSTASTFQSNGSDSKSEMRSDARAEQLQGLLVKVLQTVGSCVIMIEDIHTMDMCSWKLLQAVQESCPAIWLAVSLRPLLVVDSPAEAVMMKSLMKAKSAKHVVIAPFTKEETLKLSQQQLGASVPGTAVDELFQSTSGHPIYVIEILMHLKEVQGNHNKDDDKPFDVLGHLRQLSQAGNDISGRLNLTSMITARIDRLIPTEQLTLKVASVLGDQICAEWVLAIHPMHSAKDESSFEAINEQLDQLCQMGLLVQHKERMDFYRFDSAMLREVTYELIPHGQRMALHAKFASALDEFVEDAYVVAVDHDLGPFGQSQLEMIAENYLIASQDLEDQGLIWNAVDAFERAAEYSKSQRKLGQAIGMYRKAYSLCVELQAKHGEDAVDPLRLTKWHRICADLHHELGETADAVDQILQALDCIRAPAHNEIAHIMFIRKIRRFLCLMPNDTNKAWMSNPRLHLEVGAIAPIMLNLADSMEATSGENTRAWLKYVVRLCKYYQTWMSPAEVKMLQEVKQRCMDHIHGRRSSHGTPQATPVPSTSNALSTSRMDFVLPT